MFLFNFIDLLNSNSLKGSAQKNKVKLRNVRAAKQNTDIEILSERLTLETSTPMYKLFCQNQPELHILVFFLNKS